MKKYLYKIRGVISLSILFFIFETVLTSNLLIFPGNLIDKYINQENDILKLIYVYVLLFTLYLVSCYVSNRLSDYRRIRFEKEIKRDFFNSVIDRKYRDFREYEIGEYISMQSNDVSQMCQNYLSPFIALFRSAIMIFIFGIYLLIYVDLSITIVILACSFLTMFSPMLTANRLSKLNSDYIKRLGKYVSKTTDFFKGHSILDRLAKQKISEENDKDLEEVYNKFMRFRKINSLAYVINGGSLELVSVVTFVLVAYLLFKNTISVGMATTAFMYSTKFTEPIYELNLNIGRIKSVKDIKRKLLSILEYKRIYKDSIADVNSIELSKITKNFDESNISIPNIRIEKGKKYLIVGGNGSGKSVMLKILMNNMLYDSGKLIYNRDVIEELDTDLLFSYAPQDSVIFDTNYYNNVSLYGTYSIDNIEKYESYFSSIIISRIKKMDSLINLSGGEKQIVSIIRTLCMNKPIIVLDEPFSAMNNSNIEFFMNNITEIEKTLIIVAHNLNNYFDKFDEIIDMNRKN